MPIYEYKCKSCKNEFKKLSKDCHSKTNCPECKSDDVEKLVSNISENTHEGCENCQSCSGCHH